MKTTLAKGLFSCNNVTQPCNIYGMVFFNYFTKDSNKLSASILFLITVAELELELDLINFRESESDHLPSYSATLGCGVGGFWMMSKLDF